MDPIAFAEARLAELEAAAKQAQSIPAEWYEIAQQAIACTDTIEIGFAYLHIVGHDPARALRDVEAARRILVRYQDCVARMKDPAAGAFVWEHAREYQDFVIPNLLVRWADHPDYDQAWRP